MDCDELFDAFLDANRAAESHWEAMPMQDGIRWITVEWYEEWRKIERARDAAAEAFVECAGRPE